MTIETKAGVPMEEVLGNSTAKFFQETFNSDESKYLRGALSAHFPDGIPSEVRMRLSGYLFEDANFRHMRRVLGDQGRLVTSPTQTFDVFRSTYPGLTMEDNFFGLQPGLYGMSLPDGIILDVAHQGVATIGGLVEITSRNVLSANMIDKIARISNYGEISLKKMINPESIIGRMRLIDSFARVRDVRGVKKTPDMILIVPKGFPDKDEVTKMTVVESPINSHELKTAVDFFSSNPT